MSEGHRTSKQKRRRMREVVERLQRYIATYSDQPDYDLYTDETFIKDILYGIGVALDPNEYRCADGFDKFKPLLRPHIGLPVEPSELPALGDELVRALDTLGSILNGHDARITPTQANALLLSHEQMSATIRTAPPPSADRLRNYFDNANCISHPSLFYSSADPFNEWCAAIDEYMQERAAVTKDETP